jgi:hypothetical protein
MSTSLTVVYNINLTKEYSRMKTLKLRIKDKHAKVLTSLAKEANFVWNYGNELCFNFRKKAT